MKQPQQRKAKLPWAVLRGVVSENRFAPPANLDPSLRRCARDMAARLSRIDPGVWKLEIDWRKDAATLDRCANITPVGRISSAEKDSHKKIAAAMRKAADLLNTEGQSDPTLIGTIGILAEHYSEKFKPFYLRRKLASDEPRLSDFLKAAASFIEGERVKVYGVHRIEGNDVRSGEYGAAIRAAASLRWFFESRTGRPHNDFMKSIILAYFPNIEERDWASTLDKRKSTSRAISETQ